MAWEKKFVLDLMFIYFNIYLVIGMNGVSEDDIQKVQELVMSTVKKLAEEGFNTDT